MTLDDIELLFLNLIDSNFDKIAENAASAKSDLSKYIFDFIAKNDKNDKIALIKYATNLIYQKSCFDIKEHEKHIETLIEEIRKKNRYNSGPIVSHLYNREDTSNISSLKFYEKYEGKSIRTLITKNIIEGKLNECNLFNFFDENYQNCFSFNQCDYRRVRFISIYDSLIEYVNVTNFSSKMSISIDEINKLMYDNFNKTYSYLSENDPSMIFEDKIVCYWNYEEQFVKNKEKKFEVIKLGHYKNDSQYIVDSLRNYIDKFNKCRSADTLRTILILSRQFSDPNKIHLEMNDKSIYRLLAENIDIVFKRGVLEGFYLLLSSHFDMIDNPVMADIYRNSYIFYVQFSYSRFISGNDCQNNTYFFIYQSSGLDYIINDCPICLEKPSFGQLMILCKKCRTTYHLECYTNIKVQVELENILPDYLKNHVCKPCPICKCPMDSYSKIQDDVVFIMSLTMLSNKHFVTLTKNKEIFPNDVDIPSGYFKKY